MFRTLKANNPNFFNQLQNLPSPKILVLDILYLGDTIHLIPALNAIRQSLPNAQLHTMVCEHIAPILTLTPWVDKVLTYPRYPKRPNFFKNIKYILQIRKEKYDAIINLNGNDRSTLFTALSGAPLRAGRIPGKLPPLWPFAYNYITYYPYEQESCYFQRWKCITHLGFPSKNPEFNITIPPDTFSQVKKLINTSKPFFHVAPCGSTDCKEIPIPQLASLLNHAHQSFPNFDFVFSGSNSPRETNKLQQLLPLLQFTPASIFRGDLHLLPALMSLASLHIGPDSGPLHVALLTNTPTFCWFRNMPGLFNEFALHRPIDAHIIGSTALKAPFLDGISTDSLLSLFSQHTHKLNLSHQPHNP